MNVYIYDDFLDKNKYRRALNRIEIRLTDLGLNGKIIRLGAIKNVKEVIQSEIKGGAKNIVAVGDNYTANKVIRSMIDNKEYDFFQKDILFSIIPVGSNNSLADSLGIKKEEEACNILLARRIKELDIAIAGKDIFLNKAELNSNNAEIKVGTEYSLELLKRTKLQFLNIDSEKNGFYKEKIRPDDSLINLLIKSRSGQDTFISESQFKISGEGELLLDDCLSVELPTQISISTKKINVIVGKDRFFH